MALAILPGSLATPSCMAAKRAVERPSRKRSANFGAIFHNILTLDFNVLGHFYFESYRYFPFSVQMSQCGDGIEWNCFDKNIVFCCDFLILNEKINLF